LHILVLCLFNVGNVELFVDDILGLIGVNWWFVGWTYNVHDVELSVDNIEQMMDRFIWLN